MKKTVIFLSIAILSAFQGNLLAQNNSESKTLLGNDFNLRNAGFFVAPAFAFTQMDGAAASLFHLRGGISLGDQLALGGFFSHSLNQIQPQSETLPNVYMDYWSVGGFLEYTLLSDKILHLTFPLYIGGGEVEMDRESGDLDIGEAYFFTVEPSALLEINVHKFVRFNLGAGYRIMGQMNYRNLDQSDLSGLTGYAGLKIGLFR